MTAKKIEVAVTRSNAGLRKSLLGLGHMTSANHINVAYRPAADAVSLQPAPTQNRG